jgi:hypothetical protein
VAKKKKEIVLPQFKAGNDVFEFVYPSFNPGTGKLIAQEVVDAAEAGDTEAAAQLAELVKGKSGVIRKVAAEAAKPKKLSAKEQKEADAKAAEEAAAKAAEAEKGE